MIVWLNGAFGSGKTTVAYELCERLPGATVFDPEELGFFLFKHLPPECRTPDFQDIPLWREGNRRLLEELNRDYPGVVIVPMTLVNPLYWREIIGQLRDSGVEVRHFILSAQRDTLLRRLKKRSLGRLSREQFAVDAIERCLTAFEHHITEERIPTDGREIGEITEDIAARCGLTLLPPASVIKRRLSLVKTWLKHIRIGT